MSILKTTKKAPPSDNEFEGSSDIPVYEKATFPGVGKYVLEVVEIYRVTNKEGRLVYGGNFIVRQSTNPDHAEGTKIRVSKKMTKFPQYYQRFGKNLAMAVLRCSAEEYRDDFPLKLASEENPAAGELVELEVKAQDDSEFFNYFFSPYSSDKAA